MAACAFLDKKIYILYTFKNKKVFCFGDACYEKMEI